MADQPDTRSANDKLRLQRALASIQKLRAQLAAAERARTEPIAIVGMGCRFPGAPNPEAYWRLLHQGHQAIREVPGERWDLQAYYDPDPEAPGKMYTQYGGFLDHIDLFDASFFEVSPRVAIHLDPQHRLLLEVGWEALEHAALNPEALDGSLTGVFVGMSPGEYHQWSDRRDEAPVGMYDVMGNANSVAGARLSYLLGLQGPNLTLDTACSSSLVAVHLAVTALRNGECDLALAGGVNVLLSPDVSVAFCRARALATDGRCKTFDAEADGYVRSEGCGLVVLKRLADALADGDNVLALIRGSAVNHDGRTNGLTAPSGVSQQVVIRQALRNGGVAPAEVSYVEAHGTGTRLGDPIEVHALGAVFQDHSAPLLIGSAKTNIGHLETAAGVAGLIKVVLALQHGEIPPSLHFRQPNPHIAWDSLPVSVVAERTPWLAEKKLAGVSSFGFSGTNAHVVLEQAPDTVVATKKVERPQHILTLSAKTEQALTDLAQQYAGHLAEASDVSLEDVCFTANTGRAHFRHRLGVVAATTDECHERLVAFTAGKKSKWVSAGYAGESLRIAFLFTGQGAQYAGMGRQLYTTHPAFRRSIDRCDEILRAGAYLEKPLLEVLYPATDAPDAALIETTAYAQPALFAIEYALAELWQSWGVRPDVLLGHSTGEYVAACVAGVFSLEDGLRLIAERARLIQAASSGGATAAVLAQGDEVADVLLPFAETVHLAGINGPRETLIAGQAAAVNAAVEALEEAGLDSRRLKIPHAPHSPMVEPVLDEFEAIARQVTYHPPRTKLISNVTGRPVRAIDAVYWRRHMRETVRFMEGVQQLEQEQCTAMIEIGPQPVLQLLGRQCWRGPKVLWLTSLWEIHDDWQQLLQSVGSFYAHGGVIDWHRFEREYSRRKVILPTYPFQKKRHWLQEKEVSVKQQPDSTQQTRRASIMQALQQALAAQLDLDSSLIEPYVTFVELGADSLLLAKLVQDVEDDYGVRIGMGQLFEELNSFETLATHLDDTLPATWQPAGETAAGRAIPTGTPSPEDGQPAQHLQGVEGSTAIERIMTQQIQVMHQQLEVLRNNAPQPSDPPQRQDAAEVALEPSSGPRSPAPTPPAAILTPDQQRHLDRLITDYTRRTATSKQRATTYRARRADTRAMNLFRPEIKEMVYPIVGQRAEGAHFWDIDGNEYIDIAMGIGTLLCGHMPPFIAQALAAQLKHGMQTGPISDLADEVAAQICELTSMERVLFGVTGTGAVQGALRLAHAATGRPRFVMFSGAYHGQSDRTLALPDIQRTPTHARPMYPGISRRAVGDAIILPYGRAQALDVIKEQAREVAAVLVEPVQSRNPGLQPAAFLQELRQLTADHNIPLIFDEVITGFRSHPGGAQAWFGVEADLVTYGKSIGGGMPISVVAGRGSLLDHVDGGAWTFGDTSSPHVETTFIGSTFEMHPLALATTRAMLHHLKQEGPALQERLNRRTQQMTDTLNAFFEREEVPITVSCFASLFRFVWKGNVSYLYRSLDIDLFYYHLIEKGIYLWEGRTCFLSTAHTDSDLERLIEAVKETVLEMRATGWLAASTTAAGSPVAPVGLQASEPTTTGEVIRLSEEQQLLWAQLRRNGSSSPDWCVPANVLLRGPLQLALLRGALQKVVDRHEALRTVFRDDGVFQDVRPTMHVDVELVDLTHVAVQDRDDAILQRLTQEAERPFDLAAGPLLRVHMFELEADLHLLALLSHHIVTDGWSVGIMLEELAALYSAACQGSSVAFEPPHPYRKFIQWQAAQRQTEAMAVHETYWMEQFRTGLPVAHLPTDRPRTVPPSPHGERYAARLEAELCQAIKQVGREHRCTLFMMLLAAYALLLHRLTAQDDLVIGTPTAARTFKESMNMVGYCTHLLPIRSNLKKEGTFAEYLATIQKTTSAAYNHQAYPFARLVRKTQRNEAPHSFPLTTIFNLDQQIRPAFSELEAVFYPAPSKFALVDLRLDAVEVGEEIWLDYDYRPALFDAATICRWHDFYRSLLEDFVSDPEKRVADLQASTH